MKIRPQAGFRTGASVTIGLGFVALLVSWIVATPAWSPTQGALVAAGFVAVTALAAVQRREYRAPALLVMAIAFGVRVALATALFLISWWNLPIFRSVQMGEGFWWFAQDPPAYNTMGRRIVEALATGGEMPKIVAEKANFALVGSIYWVFGAHPLNVVYLNALWGVLLALACFLVARHFDVRLRYAVLIALGCALWPSGLLWSTQMLKDPIATGMVMVILLGVSTGRERQWSLRWARTWGAGLVVIFTLLGQLRMYAALTCAAGFLVVAAWPLLGREWRRGVTAAALGVCFTVASFFGGAVDPIELLASTARAEQQPAPVTAEASPQDSGATPGEAEEGRRGLLPSLDDIDREARTELGRAQPDKIGDVREGFLDQEEAASSIDTRVRIDSFGDFIGYYPRAILLAIGAPFPWEWFRMGSRTGFLRPLTALEMIPLYVLLGGLGWLLWSRGGVWRPEVGFALVLAILGTGYLAAAVPNLGALYRLRLQFLLPGILVTLSMLAVHLGRHRPADDRDPSESTQ